MGLRPARTIRELRGPPWARISQKKPRKSYVKGAPNVRVRQFNMGTLQYYECELDLVAVNDIQIRDNAVEAARQAANKFLEKHLLDRYFFQIMVYPHLVIREHSALGVAGADRISKGMKKAFGKPKGRMARVRKGTTVFRVLFNKADTANVKSAVTRAKLKLSGTFSLIVKDITKDAANIARRGKVVTMKKKAEEVKPAAAAEIKEAPKEGEAPAAGEKKEAPSEAKAEGKTEKKEEKKK
ncbi:50S ribosomal protein L16 [Candidatus Micrarchaeota archaeon]|nr:50S ribosomal protein L16 [Candidatus Micrarchaeota archaeon]